MVVGIPRDKEGNRSISKSNLTGIVLGDGKTIWLYVPYVRSGDDRIAMSAANSRDLSPNPSGVNAFPLCLLTSYYYSST